MKMTFRLGNKSYLYITGIVVLIFLISSNIAWLNPRPDFEVVKVPKKIPFMWQYNKDSGVEILSAAYFPKAFKTYPMRINRPAYPMAVYLIGNAVGLALKPVINLNPLERAGIGYIILKLTVYMLGGILMFKILKGFGSDSAALYAVALTFFHYHSIRFIATFHTGELQFITPIIIIYLFMELGKSYSTKKNILFSIIVGVLMLARQNYATYLAVIVYALLKRRFREAGISIISHGFPLALWLIFLKLYGLEYYNQEAEVYGQGVWLYKEFIYKNPIEMIKLLILSFNKYLSLIASRYSVWIFLAVFATGFVRRVDKRILLLFSLCFFTTWLQVFASKQIYEPRMASDLSLFVFGISAYAMFDLLGSVSSRARSRLISLILFGWLIINVIQFVNFPWIHPYDQKSYPAERYTHKLNAYTEDKMRETGNINNDVNSPQLMTPDLSNSN